MAYRDIDGRITIDEVVAMSDVNKAASAITTLTYSKKELQGIISELSQYKGETASSIIEKSEEMIRRINEMIKNLEESQRYIKSVVAHYQEVDARCSELLRNSMK